MHGCSSQDGGSGSPQTLFSLDMTPPHYTTHPPLLHGIARSKRDGTRAETRFGLSAKRMSPFKLAGVSVQSATGSRGVCISGSNAG